MDKATRLKVRKLLAAVDDQPQQLPLDEIVGLAGAAHRVTVDREGNTAVVFVSPRPDPRFDALTAREYEVATLVAAGFSNRQIAEALFISTGTVKDHVHSILQKTDLSSRAEVSACWYGHL